MYSEGEWVIIGNPNISVFGRGSQVYSEGVRYRVHFGAASVQKGFRKRSQRMGINSLRRLSGVGERSPWAPPACTSAPREYT